MEAYGAGEVELSCFHLLDAAGVRVDASATLTSSIAPATGAVANLQDDNVGTAARWLAQSVGGLALAWDFGGNPANVYTVQLAGDSFPRFLLIAALQFSDDGLAWAEQAVYSGIAWPGAKAKSSLSAPAVASDSFTSDPTSRMTALRGAWEWSSATQAVRCNTSDASMLRLDALPALSPGMYMEMSQRVVSDPYGIRHTGFFLSYGSGVTGVRIASITGGLIMSRWVNNAEDAAFATAPNPAAAEVVVGDLVVWRVEYLPGGVFNLSLNGTLRLTGTLPSISGDLFCGIFGYVGVQDTENVTTGPPISPFLVMNKVKGRAASIDPHSLGTGPAIVYGIPQLNAPVNLTIESGSVKDHNSGVLGTGRGRVAGTVKEKGTPDAPVYRKVRLIRERDGLLIREAWSNPATGAYSFDYVDELQKFTVLSYDHTGAFRAVVADGQIPELIA